MTVQLELVPLRGIKARSTKPELGSSSGFFSFQNF